MLTKRQKQILDYIQKFIKENDYAPSLEEVKQHFGLSSVSTVHQHIETLRAKGHLEKVDNQPRSIEISKNKKNLDLVEIPLVSTIAAGKPIGAIEETETMKIPKSQLSKSGEHYALKVKGNSTINDGIFDGDVVIIRKQPTAENGETVVAVLNDNEITLKKFYREKRGFRLQPANPNIKPIFTKKLEIHGKAISVIRSFEELWNEDARKNPGAFQFQKKKEFFLNSLRSSNKNSSNKYKRVVETPIRYAGGKSLGIGFVVELLPDNLKRIISPFFGGGSIEIACNRYLGLEIIGYDIFDILVNYWNIQIKKPKELYRKLSTFNPNAKTYKQVKEVLKQHWQGKEKLSPLDLAAHYYFNHNLSYGPGFLGWPSKIYLNKERYKTMLEKVRNFSTVNLEVRCASFEEAFEKYPDDFFYCDPPYFLGPDTKMFRGIYPMRNMPIHHNGFEHEKLRDLLQKHRGGFILSYNNCPTIGNWYTQYQQHFPKWQYTMGQGETRIGKNRKENGNNNHIKASHEILIYRPPNR